MMSLENMNMMLNCNAANDFPKPPNPFKGGSSFAKFPPAVPALKKSREKEHFTSIDLSDLDTSRKKTPTNRVRFFYKFYSFIIFRLNLNRFRCALLTR